MAGHGERPSPDLHRETAVRPSCVELVRYIDVWLAVTHALLHLTIVLLLPPVAERAVLHGLPHAAGADGFNDQDHSRFSESRTSR
jgi:hypothetical protein